MVRLNDHPNMTSAVYYGGLAINLTKMIKTSTCIVLVFRTSELGKECVLGVNFIFC